MLTPNRKFSICVAVSKCCTIHLPKTKTKVITTTHQKKKLMSS